VFHGVKYQITIINWIDYRRSVTKMDTWTFSKDGLDRGWHDMVRVTDLTQESGWLGPDNSLYVRASCFVRQGDGINLNSDYNAKKETGYIGLKNHGATCYMNGLLQSLFHVGEFRKIVYMIDCDDHGESAGKEDSMEYSKLGDADGDGKAPPLIQALQNVFYKLQTSDQAVNCRELMKSFGWDTMDAFTQQDAQELNRILCDRLEEQMKGSPMDGSIKRLFEGEMENYIECIDVAYKSKRNETFYDIQLNIKGENGRELHNIEESLRDFTAEETLEGDNAYEAEGHGKQRAKKGIRFITFPPVLNLQLKRFHFDLEKMDMVKLNTRFEFHRKLDLTSFAPNAGIYILYAVVVHSGDVNSGHYYAHIRPNLEQGWFKFDDDVVTPCSEFAAVEDNFGGSDLTVWNYFDKSPAALRGAQTPTRARIHNAYMLVYIREDLAAKVLEPPDPKMTNNKMVQRCDREVWLADQRRRERLEQQLKIRIRLVFDRDLCKMTGFWDHVDIPHEHSLKMGRDQSVKDLAAEVEALVKVPQKHLALFSLQYRQFSSGPIRFHGPE
jgi:ubiquitin carboxyl-terminal hydrolase 7